MITSIIVTKNEGWTKIVLNRPDRLNAFNEEMHRAFEEAADHACRAVFPTGEGHGFCR